MRTSKSGLATAEGKCATIKATETVMTGIRPVITVTSHCCDDAGFSYQSLLLTKSRGHTRIGTRAVNVTGAEEMLTTGKRELERN